MALPIWRQRGTSCSWHLAGSALSTTRLETTLDLNQLVMSTKQRQKEKNKGNQGETPQEKDTEQRTNGDDTCTKHARTIPNSSTGYAKLWELQIFLDTEWIVIFPHEDQVLYSVTVWNATKRNGYQHGVLSWKWHAEPNLKVIKA